MTRHRMRSRRLRSTPAHGCHRLLVISTRDELRAALQRKSRWLIIQVGDA